MPSQSIAGFMIAGYGAEAEDAGGDVVFLGDRDQAAVVDEVQDTAHVRPRACAVSMYVSMCPRGT